MKNILLAILALILLLGVSTSVRSTGPTEVGVLVKKLSLFGTPGVQQEVYAPGRLFFSHRRLSVYCSLLAG